MKLLPGCTAPLRQQFDKYIPSCFPMAISLATGEEYIDVCKKINAMGCRFDSVPHRFLDPLIRELVGPVEEFKRYKRSQCLLRWCQGKYNGAWILRVIRRDHPGKAHAMIVQNGRTHDGWSAVGGQDYNAKQTARVTDVWKMKNRFRFV